MSSWRFLPYSEHCGATNMAIDEVLLEDVIAGNCGATLRLYGFSPPAVSIGLNQQLDDATIARIQANRIDVVRRPTGGRAVLHLHDLTYSFTCADETAGGPLKSSVTAAYRQICQGLIESLRLLGLQTELGESQSPYRHLADCFLATTPADLHCRGWKIAGSAQVRRRGAVLQHGSIPLRQEQDALTALLHAALDTQGAKPQRHLNLFDEIGYKSVDELNSAFIQGFQRAFATPLVTGALTEEELQSAHSQIPHLLTID